jgi:hypothetical protein
VSAVSAEQFSASAIAVPIDVSLITCAWRLFVRPARASVIGSTKFGACNENTDRSRVSDEFAFIFVARDRCYT